jgi:hypothetical protein
MTRRRRKDSVVTINLSLCFGHPKRPVISRQEVKALDVANV